MEVQVSFMNKHVHMWSCGGGLVISLSLKAPPVGWKELLPDCLPCCLHREWAPFGVVVLPLEGLDWRMVYEVPC